MDPDTVSKRTPTNIMLSQEERRQLAELAARNSASMGHILRECVAARYAHEVRHDPHCSIGLHCLCPQIWTGANASRKDG